MTRHHFGGKAKTQSARYQPEMNDSTTMASEIGRLRKARNWSVIDLAARLGVSRETIRRWENGSRNPRPGELEALATAFGARIEVVVTGAEPVSLTPMQQEALQVARSVIPTLSDAAAAVVRDMLRGLPTK